MIDDGDIMKDVELRLICELMRNCRKSDRELAKAIGVSQPTVSRVRTRLEREGVIEYTGVPNLEKLGYEIIAITFAKWKREQYPDEKVPEALDFLRRHPNMLFVSTGMGIGSDRVTVSVHKNYSGFTKFVRELQTEWEEFMKITDSFLMALKSDNVLSPLSMKYLADCLREEESE